MSKIAIFTYSVFTVGGEQRVVCLLANELCKYHDVTIYTMDTDCSLGNVFGLTEDVKIEYYHPYKNDIISFAFRAATHLTPALVYNIFPSILERAYCADKYAAYMNSLLDDSFDVVIATAWQLSIILGKVKKKYNRRFKAIAWEHSSYEFYFEKKNYYLYKHEKLFADNLQYVDEVLVLNEDYQKKYAERLGLKSQVMYNPKTFESPSKAELTNKTIFACSRIDDEAKGIDLLIEAFSLFCNREKEWQLVIAGDGPSLDKYKNNVESIGLSDRIRFIGRINNVSERLLEASVFVLPSRFEGFPMSVTEAFEVGLPVLAFDIPAMIPFVQSGGAITVPSFDVKAYSDKMYELATNYELRRIVGGKGMIFADELSIKTIGSKWNSLLADILLD